MWDRLRGTKNRLEKPVLSAVVVIIVTVVVGVDDDLGNTAVVVVVVARKEEVCSAGCCCGIVIRLMIPVSIHSLFCGNLKKTKGKKKNRICFLLVFLSFVTSLFRMFRFFFYSFRIGCLMF